MFRWTAPRARAAHLVSRVAHAGLALLPVFAAAGGSASRATPPMPIAIVDFEYIDTSGEVEDQSGKHAALLKEFMSSLRRDLEAKGPYHAVALACEPAPCSTAEAGKLLSAARAAGAALLLYGGIHKESTLVQWAKVEVADVQEDRLVYSRLYTFRGDNDEAWRRAEAFLAADLNAHAPAQ